MKKIGLFTGLIIAACLTNGRAQCENQMPQATDFQKATPINLSGNADFTGGAHVMEMSFANDGRLFFVTRQGHIGLYENGQLSKIHELTVWDQGTVMSTGAQGLEAGLRGIALDPNFETNNWMYVAYDEDKTRADFIAKQELTTNIVRLTYNPANKTIVANSERVILSYMSNGIDHVSGSLAFGPTGILHYLSGDDTDSQSFNQFAPLNWAADVGGDNACRKFDDQGSRVPGGQIRTFSPCVSDASRSTANTNDLRGKTLRIIPIAFPDIQTPTPGEGTTYTIPSGNLFVDNDPLTRPEIYTMGHRAGWRLTVDPVQEWVLIGEGGPASTTQTSNGHERGPYGHEEYNIANKASFFGWPYFNGDNEPYRPWDFMNNVPLSDNSGFRPLFDPATGVTNESPRNTGARTLPVATAAAIWHSRRGISGIPNGTSASHSYFNNITGCVGLSGPRYYYGLHSRSTGSTFKLPPYLHEKWLISDTGGGFLGAATLSHNDATGVVSVTDIEEIPVGGMYGGNLLDFEISPDGVLYFAMSNSQIRTIAYTGSCRPPDAPYISVANKAIPSNLFTQMVTGGNAILNFPNGKNIARVYNLSGKEVWSSNRSSEDVRLPANLKNNLYYVRFE